MLSAQHPGYWDTTWLSLLSPSCNHTRHPWGTQLLLFNSSLLNPRKTVTFLSVPNFQKSLTGYIFFSTKIGVVGTCPIRFKINNNNSITQYWENIKKKLCFMWHFGRFLSTKWTYWYDFFKIFSGIFWHKLRVPIWHRKGVWRLKNDYKMEKKKKTQNGFKDVDDLIFVCAYC